MNESLLRNILAGLLVIAAALVEGAAAQGFEAEPVFRVALHGDRAPAVAGEVLNLAVELRIDDGWHVNSDDPGDEFSIPTTIEWLLPAGWPQPRLAFPAGEKLSFDFSDQPVAVWEGRVLIPATIVVPAGAALEAELALVLTAQACNNTQCLPPLPVRTSLTLAVAPEGSVAEPVNQELFGAITSPGAAALGDSAGASDVLAGKSLPLLLLLVFLGGLALNLTPCVFPLIPITVGYFTRQTTERQGSVFPLALAYVLGIAVTYSVLGVAAALFGMLFGGALQSPWVVALIVLVMLALAASMFGLWELRVPRWAQRASGGRTGFVGALLMGLVVGFVAAPCIGPFVLGLVTLVGQRGDPIFGLLVFFVLSLGLGLPYLVLGTFTGLINRLPMAGMWMVGVRRVFGVILIAMAAYFAAPVLPGESGTWLMAAVMVLGGLYLLVIDRTGHEQPVVDRLMRLVCVAMVVIGVLQAPGGRTVAGDGLSWRVYDEAELAAAIASGQPVIVDFYADWCAPCRELEEKTFADPRVAAILDGYARFKVDQTTSDATAAAAARSFGVVGVPTVIVYDDGAEVFRVNAFEPADRFLERLQ